MSQIEFPEITKIKKYGEKRTDPFVADGESFLDPRFAERVAWQEKGTALMPHDINYPEGEKDEIEFIHQTPEARGVLINKEGKVLLQRDKAAFLTASGEHDTFWGLPGGANINGENWLVALVEAIGRKIDTNFFNITRPGLNSLDSLLRVNPQKYFDVSTSIGRIKGLQIDQKSVRQLGEGIAGSR